MEMRTALLRECPWLFCIAGSETKHEALSCKLKSNLNPATAAHPHFALLSDSSFSSSHCCKKGVSQSQDKLKACLQPIASKKSISRRGVPKTVAAAVLVCSFLL